MSGGLLFGSLYYNIKISVTTQLPIEG